jgi:diaminohydroxyphosphoribosylaminopyrimidine deaminase/5-amino-6-(5-phosphoribosylamino)uracil reductase
MVGAVIVRQGRVLGQGWHRQAGGPHAEIEALRDAERHGRSVAGATLYVTLEPCCTHGRTPPCTDAIVAARLACVVAAATDPNPHHAGRGFTVLRAAGIAVETGLLAGEATRLNEAFNHWIVNRTPFVTVKAAMTLDGKIATADGESKWITAEPARRLAHRLRLGADAVLVGVNTVLADDPSLTVRQPRADADPGAVVKPIRRLVLDSRARTPLRSKLVTDPWAAWTTVFVGPEAPAARVRALERRVKVVLAPQRKNGLDLRWILRRLGQESITNLLVEGGGEVNAAFLAGGLAQRVAFFYAPKILGGRDAHRAVAGAGAGGWSSVLRLTGIESRRCGPDLFLTARISQQRPGSGTPRSEPCPPLALPGSKAPCTVARP